MNIKSIMDRVLFALSVPKCIRCNQKLDYGQKAFCPKCSAEFEEFKTRNCVRCGRVLNRCDCSTRFLESHFVTRVVKCYRYLHRVEAEASNELIYSLKKDHRRDVLEVCTDELELAISNSIEHPENCVFTNVPRRKAAIIQYGFDHSALLLQEVAKRFDAEYISILKSNAKKPQRSLDSAERMKNADFDIVKDIDLTGREVIIVDDIITSGASMRSAAALIRSLGCKKITVACLAIAYKDDIY